MEPFIQIDPIDNPEYQEYLNQVAVGVQSDFISVEPIDNQDYQAYLQNLEQGKPDPNFPTIEPVDNPDYQAYLLQQNTING